MIEVIKYIESGEFTFCSRCGDICHLRKEDFMCRSCTSSLFSRKNLSDLEKEEKQLYIEMEESVSIILREYRKELAELRYNDSC